MTVTVQPDTAEVEQLDVDALRMAATRHLLDLADEHNLRGLRDINFNDDQYGGRQRVWLHLYLDDDQLDAHAAWTQVLGLGGRVNRAHPPSLDPVLSHNTKANNLLGLDSIELTTFLHPARGLPEQGPRPTDAELIVAAALTPDAPQLPADPTCADCGVHVPGASADPWLQCDPCKAMTSVQRDLYLAVLAQGRDPLAVLGMYEGRAEADDIVAVKRRLGLPDADREQIAAEDELLHDPEWVAAEDVDEPCQPIGCDNGYHLPGCTYAVVDEQRSGVSE